MFYTKLVHSKEKVIFIVMIVPVYNLIFPIERPFDILTRTNFEIIKCIENEALLLENVRRIYEF